MTPSTLPSSHMPACPSPGHFLSTPIPSLYSTHTESCLSSFPRALIYTSPASCRALPEASPAFSVTVKYLSLRDLGIFSYFTHFHILHLADSNSHTGIASGHVACPFTLPRAPSTDPGTEWATQSSVRDENTLALGGIMRSSI